MIIIQRVVNSDRAICVIASVKIRQMMLVAMISTVFRVELDTDLRREKEPLSHWVAEEDQLDKFRRVLRPVGNDE